MKHIRDRHIFSQRLHVTVCSAAVSEESRFSAFSFCVPCWPIVWFHRKRWPGKLCVASSCDLLIVLSTDGDRPCKWRWTFSKCLCIFSEVSLCHHRPVVSSHYIVIFDRRWSSIPETHPAQRCCVLRGMASMLVNVATSTTSVLVTKSLQLMFRMGRRRR